MVDYNEYMDDRKQNRIRFSIAHELGYSVLHRKIYQEMSYASIEAWIDFIQRLPEDQYSYIEQQAYEFAWRLLVPVDHLKMELKSAAVEAEKSGFIAWDQSDDAAREYIANSLSPIFGVSGQAIKKRITHEKLWPPN